MKASHVTSRQPGQSGGQRTDVDAVVWARPSLPKVPLQRRLETLLALTLDGGALTRERHSGGELAQQLQQR
jgi:hypothetical protein